jgi:hypothetical protein
VLETNGEADQHPDTGAVFDSLKPPAPPPPPQEPPALPPPPATIKVSTKAKGPAPPDTQKVPGPVKV